MVDSAPVSGSDGEIDVPSSGDGEGVAIFDSHHVVHLVPRRATGLAAHVAPSTGFEIVGEDAAVHPDMMPREGFSSGCLSQPFAQGNISTVSSPVPMAAVVVPPAIHGVGGNRPSLAEVKFHSTLGISNASYMMFVRTSILNGLFIFTESFSCLTCAGALLPYINNVMRRI